MDRAIEEMVSEPAIDPNWMRAEEFCGLFRMSRTTLDHYLKTGKLPHYRVGRGRGKLFFDQESVSALRRLAFIGPGSTKLRKAG